MDDLVRVESSYPTPYANTTILPMLLMSLMRQKNAPKTATTIYTEYDYVIVGARSAGSVLASRLSEVACASVLLLEAGDKPPILTEIPAINRFFWYTDIDWQFKTVPQKHMGDNLINNQLIWTTGKAIGGSSLLNDVQFTRGNRKNYDDWAKMGALGWSYSEIFKYFIRQEDNRDKIYLADGYHGYGGPQTVMMPHYTSEFKGPLYDAAKELNYPVVDPNAGSQIGFYNLQGTIRDGQLCSTAKGYLVPAENKTNLDILPKAMVRKIIIEKGIAKGVEFDFQNKTYVVRAKQEVIVSAGVVNTPKLLMLSGIGPKEELNKFKIPIVADLPVGKNLQDHVGTTANFLLNPDIPNFVEKLSNETIIKEYIDSRSGILTSAQLVTALAFLQNGEMRPLEVPDYELYFVEVSDMLAQMDFGFKPEVQEQLFGPYKGKALVTCFTHLLHPRSRGTVTIQSTDPYDPPVIDPNFFEVEDDVKDVVAGLKACQKILTSGPMQKINVTAFTTKYPGCEQYDIDSDQYLTCQVKSSSVSFFHAVGTARMGNPRHNTTVVDPYLRVVGVQGLRVVDASIMPTIPTGNPNTPTIMIAEKAADMIKFTMKCSYNPTQPSVLLTVH